MSSEEPQLEGVEEKEEVINEVLLGDSVGNDPNLEAFLANMENIIEIDSSGAGKWDVLKLIADAWSWCKNPHWKAAASVVKGGVKLFTDKEVKLINAQGKASIDRSKAKINDSEANINNAKADEIRANTKRKDTILKEMISRGITHGAEFRDKDGVLRVGFINETWAEDSQEEDGL